MFAVQDIGSVVSQQAATIYIINNRYIYHYQMQTNQQNGLVAYLFVMRNYVANIDMILIKISKTDLPGFPGFVLFNFRCRMKQYCLEKKDPKAQIDNVKVKPMSVFALHNL